MREFKYKVRFDAVANCVLNEEDDRFLAIASLDNLKPLLPKDIDFANNPDVVPLVGQGTILNRGNRNGHMLTSDKAAGFAKDCRYKLLDVDHVRSQVVGTVLNAGFSKIGNDELLSEADITANKEPIALSIAGIVWRLARPKFTKKIIASSDPSSDLYKRICLSWEVAFSEYNILVGGPNLVDGEVVSDPKQVEDLSKFLRKNGGENKMKDGTPLYTILAGDNIIPIGFGFTLSPAADVGPIETISQNGLLEEEEDEQAAIVIETPQEKTEEVAAAVDLIKESSEGVTSSVKGLTKIIDEFTNENNRKEMIDLAEKEKVSLAEPVVATSEDQTQKIDIEQKNTSHKNGGCVKVSDMKIVSIDDLAAKLTEAKASEEVVASAKSFMSEELKKANDLYTAEKAAKEKAVEEVRAQNEQLKRDSDTIKAELDKLTKTLASLEAEKAAKDAAEKFQNRMSALDSEYELDDEDRAAIVASVKDLDDAGYDKWFNTFKVIAKSKSKKAKAQKKDDMKDKEPDGDECAAKVAEEALASAKVTSTPIANASTVTTSLKDKYKAGLQTTVSR